MENRFDVLVTRLKSFGDLQEGDVLLFKPNDEIKTGQNVVVKM